MRFLILLAILFFINSQTTLAQIAETALGGNPVLFGIKQQQQKKDEKRFSSLKASFAQNFIAGGRSGEDDFRCVTAGSTDTVCMLPPQGPGAGAFVCLDCDQAENGQAVVDTNCLFFSATPGVFFGQDTVSVQFCDTLGTCDTFTYCYVISRPNDLVIEPLTVIEAEEEIFLQADTTNLPGFFQTGWGIECQDSTLSEGFGFGNTLYYKARRFAGFDTACLIIFDRYCTVDTVKFPFKIIQDTLSITADMVFFDDFSYEGPYPAERYWLDKNTFVNSTLGGNPPSVGMATFDGVDEGGTPYGGGYGISDYLTSVYMDLENITDQVYLSFWYQIKGYSLPPLNQDSLVVEFKQPDGRWIIFSKFPGNDGIPLEQVPPFEFLSIQVPESYHYNGFQFRIRNSSNNKGLSSMWHVDYVLLRDGYTQPPTQSFSDLTFIEKPSRLLKDFAAIPWSHFYTNPGGLLVEDFNYRVANNSSFANNPTSSQLSLREAIPGSPNLFPDTLTLIDGGPNIQAGGELMASKSINVVRNSLINQLLNNYPDTGNYVFTTEYNVVSGSIQANLESVERNDTVRINTVLGNYYAYDDGTAERNLTTFKKGMMVAVKYTSLQDDSLRAIQMMLQHSFSDLTKQLMNLHVWIGELDDTPEYTAGFVTPFYPDVLFDTLHGFTTYLLLDRFGDQPEPLFIPQGDFYIGWEQNSQNNPGITVGFDKNHPEGRNFGYVFNTQEWSPFTDFPGSFLGSVMMRPVFGSELPVNTPTGLEETSDYTGENHFKVYPNPANNLLYIEYTNDNSPDVSFSVSNLLGQRVLSGRMSEGVEILSLNNLNAGWYVIQFESEGALLETKRFLIHR